MRKDKPNLTFDELFEKVSTYIKDAKSIAILPFETSAPTGSDFSKNFFWEAF